MRQYILSGWIRPNPQVYTILTVYIIIYLEVVSLFKKSTISIYMYFSTRKCWRTLLLYCRFIFPVVMHNVFSTSLPIITIIVIAFIDHCLINGLCFMNSQSNESNPCQLCNSSQSNDSWTDNPGAFTLLTYQSFVMDIFSFTDFFNPRISYVEEVKWT